MFKPRIILPYYPHDQHIKFKMPILRTQLRNISVLKNKILNLIRKIVLVQAICVWNISKVCSYKYNVIAIYALMLDFLRDILILKQNFKNIISYLDALSLEAVPNVSMSLKNIKHYHI